MTTRMQRTPTHSWTSDKSSTIGTQKCDYVLESNMMTQGMEAVLVSNLPIKVQKVCRTVIYRENQGDTPYKDLNIKHFVKRTQIYL